MSRRLPGAIDERVEALSDVLEEVLAAWQSRPFAESPSSRALREACQLLSGFRDAGLGGDDPLGPLDTATKRVSLAQEQLPGWAEQERPTLREVADELATLRRDALDRLGAPQPTVTGKGAGALGLSFGASRSSPQLRHDVPMPPLSLIREERDIAVELASLMERDRDEERDDELEPDASASNAATAAAPPVSEHAQRCMDQLRFVARDLMEDVAILFGLRKPLEQEGWQSPERFEVRLLAQLDALFALSTNAHRDEPVLPLVAELYRYATEWAIPDLGRGFALALPLASIEGEASARWLLVALRHAHPRTLPAFVDALVLGPNSALPRAIGGRISSSEPARVIVALLEAARRRRDVSPSAIAMALSHPDREVVMAALRALGTVDPKVSLPLLSDHLSAEPPVALTAAVALAGLGADTGITSLRGWLELDVAAASESDPIDAPRAYAALRALACLGDRKDEPLVLRAALRIAGGLRWLGTFGEPAHAEVLLRFIDDPARRHAARRGLAILLGGDFESDDKDWAAAPELREQVMADRASRRANAASARGRLRRGAPHRGVPGLIAELADPRTTGGERADLAFELAMTTRAVIPFDAEDWIGRQRASISLLGGLAGA